MRRTSSSPPCHLATPKQKKGAGQQVNQSDGRPWIYRRRIPICTLRFPHNIARWLAFFTRSGSLALIGRLPPECRKISETITAAGATEFASSRRIVVFSTQMLADTDLGHGSWCRNAEYPGNKANLRSCGSCSQNDHTPFEHSC